MSHSCIFETHFSKQKRKHNQTLLVNNFIHKLYTVEKWLGVRHGPLAMSVITLDSTNGNVQAELQQERIAKMAKNQLFSATASATASPSATATASGSATATASGSASFFFPLIISSSDVKPYRCGALVSET